MAEEKTGGAFVSPVARDGTQRPPEDWGSGVQTEIKTRIHLAAKGQTGRRQGGAEEGSEGPGRKHAGEREFLGSLP